jgi:hypothetical protein
MVSKSPALLPFLAVVALVAGCRGSSRPATYPVGGQVTYRGKPVAGATVTFLAEGAPTPAWGTTDDSGNYRLTTFKPNDGAVVGTHVVTVSKTSEVNVSAPGAVPVDSRARAQAIEEEMQRTAVALEKAERTRPLLPQKYGERRTSDLRKEVVDGENVINIELTD